MHCGRRFRRLYRGPVHRSRRGYLRYLPAPYYLCHAAVCLTLTAGNFGCSQWTPETASGAQLLRPAVASDDSVTLEVFFAHFPAGDEPDGEPAWSEIDDQPIPVAVRQQLARNGLRTGLVAGNLPVSMARLLRLQDRRPVRADGLQTVDLQSEPTVSQRLLQLRDRQPGYIAKSEVRDELSVLWYRDGQLQGRTFGKAQCMFAVTTARQSDGRVELTLIPELQHGEARRQFTGENGFFRVEFSRPKEIFAELAIQVVLSPGQMLVVGRRPGRSGSLGQHFFSSPTAGGQVQRLLIVRLLHANPRNPFAPDDRQTVGDETIPTALSGPRPAG